MCSVLSKRALIWSFRKRKVGKINHGGKYSNRCDLFVWELEQQHHSGSLFHSACTWWQRHKDRGPTRSASPHCDLGDEPPPISMALYGLQGSGTYFYLQNTQKVGRKQLVPESPAVPIKNVCFLSPAPGLVHPKFWG